MRVKYDGLVCCDSKMTFVLIIVNCDWLFALLFLFLVFVELYTVVNIYPSKFHQYISYGLFLLNGRLLVVALN